MGLIFLAVLISATVLYGRDLGWKMTGLFWGLFILGSVLADVGIPLVPALLHLGAALGAAIKGYSSSQLPLATLGTPSVGQKPRS